MMLVGTLAGARQGRRQEYRNWAPKGRESGLMGLIPYLRAIDPRHELHQHLPLHPLNAAEYLNQTCR